MVKIQFSLTDRFNQEVNLVKTYSEKVLNRYSELELLLMGFESFVLSLGYPEDDIEFSKEKLQKEQRDRI